MVFPFQMIPFQLLAYTSLSIALSITSVYVGVLEGGEALVGFLEILERIQHTLLGRCQATSHSTPYLPPRFL